MSGGGGVTNLEVVLTQQLLLNSSCYPRVATFKFIWIMVRRPALETRLAYCHKALVSCSVEYITQTLREQ